MARFIIEQRRSWMRMRDHVVINERDRDFARFQNDPSGSILRVLRIWATETESSTSAKEQYLGSVRRCECGGWVSSRRELSRLFHRATDAAKTLGMNSRIFRNELSRVLRDNLNAPK